MYTTDHIFPVIPIKYLVNQDGEPTDPHKLVTDIKPPVLNLRVLFCLCVLQKSTVYVDTKALNMHNQSQYGFCGIFVGISQHQKRCLVYVPSTRKIFSSHDVVFGGKIQCVIIHFKSVLVSTFYVTSSLVYSISYKISLTIWRHYNFFTF